VSVFFFKLTKKVWESIKLTKENWQRVYNNLTPEKFDEFGSDMVSASCDF
jgi:hypothetical protein